VGAPALTATAATGDRHAAEMAQRGAFVAAAAAPRLVDPLDGAPECYPGTEPTEPPPPPPPPPPPFIPAAVQAAPPEYVAEAQENDDGTVQPESPEALRHGDGSFENIRHGGGAVQALIAANAKRRGAWIEPLQDPRRRREEAAEARERRGEFLAEEEGLDPLVERWGDGEQRVHGAEEALPPEVRYGEWAAPAPW